MGSNETKTMYHIYGNISKVIYYSSTNKDLIKSNYKEYIKLHRNDDLRIMSSQWWQDVTNEILK